MALTGDIRVTITLGTISINRQAVSFFGTDCIYTGCNVESSSYGLTMCAERAAICAGVSAGHRNIRQVALAMYDSSGAPLTKFAKVGRANRAARPAGRRSARPPRRALP